MNAIYLLCLCVSGLCICATSAFSSEFYTPRKGLNLPLAPGRNSPKSAEISQRHKEMNTKDFSSVYFNLFVVILPTFESVILPTRNPIQTLIWHPVAWASCVTVEASVVPRILSSASIHLSWPPTRPIYYSASTVCFWITFR